MRVGSGRRIALPQHGFTLIAVLAALLLVGLATQQVMTWVSHEARREREAQLLLAGQDLMRAIESYYEASPGAVKQWPPTLQDLTDDKRFVGIRRHLRRVPVDPVGRSAEWGLIRANDGGIMGVHSQSDAPPLRSAAIELDGHRLEPATRYADWKFMHQPRASVGGR